MESTLDLLVEWLANLRPFSIYSVFFLVAYLENVVPPIPGDLLVAFGGYLAALGLIGFFPLLAVTTVASVIGFMTVYAFGHYWGYRIEREREGFWPGRWIDIRYVDRGKRWVRKWGQWVVIANRFLAGMRTIIALVAGIYQTRIRMTVISSAVSSLLWNTLLIGLGWMVQENWQQIGAYLEVYGWIIFGALLLVLLMRYVAVRLRGAENKKKRGAS